MRVCPQCDAEFGPDKRFCPDDGSVLRDLESTGDIVGELIAGRYHVLEQLGEGGMGRVYLAEHVKIGRMDALKVLHRALANDPDAVRRFSREASNASRIIHPSVAAIYDFGETPDGVIFLAMEYVDGEPLSKLLERDGRLSVPRAVDIARQVADALQAAHELGIVHRDLKPDNIMVTRGRDGRDVVKVIDFGIAKALQRESDQVTRPGVIFGTPEYMSPEQLTGRPVDGRSDIYSLGCILYRMVTGERPFAGPSGDSWATRRLVDPPPRPSKINPEIPKTLDEAIVKALATSPDNRFEIAAEFGRALAAVSAATSDVLHPSRSRREEPERKELAWEAPVPRFAPRGTARPNAVRPTAEIDAPTVKVVRPGSADAGRARAWWLGGGVAVLAVVGAVLWGRMREPSRPALPSPVPTPLAADSADGGSSSASGVASKTQFALGATQAPPGMAASLPDTSTAATPAAKSASTSFAAVQIVGRLPRSARMMLDGRVVSDRLLRISPDTAHTIVVRAPGYRPAVWSEALGVGDTARWSPTLQRIESSVTTVPHAADTLAGAVFQAATGEVVLAERTDSAPRSAAIGAQDTLLAEPALGTGIGPSPPADSAPASVVVERSDSVGARAGGSVSDTASRDTSTRDTVALRIGTATGDLAVGRTAESKPQAAIDTMVRGTPLPRPIMPRPRAAAVDPAVAREQIQGGVDEYLQALRAGDADRISRLFKSTTDADERNERHLVNLMEMRNARLAVAQQQIGVPRILAHGATVEFRAKLTWKTPFGATRSQWIPFLAEFQQTGETWRLTRARIVGAPDLD